jgi:multiple sugar transport system substrate-binding protein
MFKKTLTMLLVAVMMLGLMVPALAQDKIQVVLWHTFTDEQETSLQEIAKAYNEQNPQVEVVVQSQPRTGFEDKVFNGVRTGTGPNLIIHFSSEAAKYVDAKDEHNTFVIDFQALLSQEDLQRVKDNLAQPVYDEAVIFEDGKMHIMPVYRSGPMTFYNKTMFDELGLKPPTTWDELESTARAIKEKYGVPGFATDSIVDTAQMLLMQNGSGYIDMENKKVVIDNPKAAERVQWFGDLVREEVFSLNPTGQYFSNDFNSRLVGMYFGSVAGYKYITPDGFELGVAPAVNDGVQLWYPAWNRGVIAFKVSEAADKATVDFVKFFTNPENSAKFAIAVGSISPYADANALPEYQAYLSDGSLLADSLKAVEVGLPYAGVLPIVSISATLRTELERAVTRVATGEATAEDALKEAAEIVNAEWVAE